MRDAARAIRAIFKGGILPSALEVADAFTLAAAWKRTGSPRLRGCRAHLIVELDGQKKSVTNEIRDLEKIIRRLRPDSSNAAWEITSARPSGKSGASFLIHCAIPASPS